MDQTQVVEEPKEPTTRESIEASIASLQEGGDKAGAVHTDPAPAGAAAPTGAGATAPAGTGAGATAPAGTGAGATAPAGTGAGAKPNVGLTDTPARQVSRGPASWRPEVREKWAALPAEVQAEVTRREREVATTLQETAQVRQFAEAFHATIAPYQHIIALEGNDPLKTFESYMKTATILRSGSPMEKADAIASAIASFGIDIAMLDNMLTTRIKGGNPMAGGQVTTQPGAHGGPQQFRDPRVDELFGFLQSQHQAKETAAQEEINSELEQFVSDPKNEFFEDLRLDIADIMRLNANRGVKVTLREAYDKAARLHPEISKVVLQRDAAKNAEESRKAALARRIAGSSVTQQAPKQTGTQSNSAATVREAIEQSIAHLQG
jgi:hypothetical protein